MTLKLLSDEVLKWFVIRFAIFLCGIAAGYAWAWGALEKRL